MGKQGDRAAAMAAVERWRRGQHGNGGGSGAAASDARWQIQQSGGGSAAAAWRRWGVRWRRGQHKGGEGTPATVLPIPLLIADARLGNVAVSLCGQ